MKKPHPKKTCLNPHCNKLFTPGHFGNLQKVCTGTAEVDCPKCKATGKREGRKCFRCLGKKKILQPCREWYRGYWAQTRKPPLGIPNEDLDRILGAVKKDPFWHSLIMVMTRGGMRKGEALGLAWSDVLSDGNVMPSFELRGQWDDRVHGFIPTKTGSGRRSYLLDEARSALAAHLSDTKKRGVFKMDGRIWEISEAATWRKFVAIQRRLGIKNKETGRPHKVHACRHTCAIRTYRATKDITRAQIMLGHKSPATTQIYAVERPEDFSASIEASFAAEKKK